MIKRKGRWVADRAFRLITSHNFLVSVSVAVGVVYWASLPGDKVGTLAVGIGAAATVWVLCGGGAVIAAMAIWIATDLGSWRHSGAWVAWVFSVMIFEVIGLFANVYLVLGANVYPSSFNGPMTSLDAIYVAVTTFTTVGSGSLTPTGELARGAVTAESLLSLLVIGVGLTQVIGRFHRRPADPLDDLMKLSELRSSGVLSDEEVEAQKARILAK